MSCRNPIFLPEIYDFDINYFPISIAIFREIRYNRTDNRVIIVIWRRMAITDDAERVCRPL